MNPKQIQEFLTALAKKINTEKSRIGMFSPKSQVWNSLATIPAELGENVNSIMDVLGKAIDQGQICDADEGVIVSQFQASNLSAMTEDDGIYFYDLRIEITKSSKIKNQPTNFDPKGFSIYLCVEGSKVIVMNDTQALLKSGLTDPEQAEAAMNKEDGDPEKIAPPFDYGDFQLKSLQDSKEEAITAKLQSVSVSDETKGESAKASSLKIMVTPDSTPTTTPDPSARKLDREKIKKLSPAGALDALATFGFHRSPRPSPMRNLKVATDEAPRVAPLISPLSMPKPTFK